MAKYIDEENLIRRMHTMAKDKNYPPYADIFKSFAFKVFKDLLMSEPTADVLKVKHGKWSRGIENSGSVYAHCSACNRKMNDYCYGYLHCPMCGAIMDGKE